MWQAVQDLSSAYDSIMTGRWSGSGSFLVLVWSNSFGTMSGRIFDFSTWASTQPLPTSMLSGFSLNQRFWLQTLIFCSAPGFPHTDGPPFSMGYTFMKNSVLRQYSSRISKTALLFVFLYSTYLLCSDPGLSLLCLLIMLPLGLPETQLFFVK